MEIALVGLPQSGKSTLFKTLTGISDHSSFSKSSGRFEPHLQIVQVPDKRLDQLSRIYNPQKTVYATIKITDIPGLQKKDFQSEKALSEIESYIGKVDALINVIQCFGEQNEVSQAVVEMEIDLIMRDLVKVETRLERIEHSYHKVAGSARKQLEEEKTVLEKCLEILNNELPLRSFPFSQDQVKILSSFQFWSLKSMLIIFNCDEASFNRSFDSEIMNKYTLQPNTDQIKILGHLEMEMNELTAEEKGDFLKAYRLEETGREKVIRNLYKLLNLLSFFTVGKDEVRAWTITRGTKAREAAGKIHSDMEKGFIRAEVISYEDLIEYQSEQEVKKQGKCRFEGKEYLVKDGDIITFLFNR